jgi:SAM-dependent methyltransferase
MAETSYGDERRFEFLRETVERQRPSLILDIGCGTGMRLTRRLAAAFPHTGFVGADADRNSIAWARANNSDLANLSFCLTENLSRGERFDIVIASEVIEHVGDPMDFLLELRARLADDGRLVITLPNGYGPFELMALTECLLNLSGLQAVLRRLKYALLGKSVAPAPAERDTLAVSPHVNFFSFREISTLCETAGFAVTRSANRCILCGYILDDVIRGRTLLELNASLADRLPSWCVSDWMIEMRVARPPGPARWRRLGWARFRKRLNERRWGLT